MLLVVEPPTSRAVIAGLSWTIPRLLTQHLNDCLAPHAAADSAPGGTGKGSKP